MHTNSTVLVDTFAEILVSLLLLRTTPRSTPLRTILTINLLPRLRLLYEILVINGSPFHENRTLHDFDFSNHDCGTLAAVGILDRFAAVASTYEY